MCGIVGILNRNGSPVNQQNLDQFTDSLAHRGPDGRGTYIDKNSCLGLGHRRLKILDLSESGRQPMSFGDGRYWITYNGEVYNFLELRRELEKFGHQFFSESDTEVILASYVQWGEDCQYKFNGMWAFAIWDTEDRKLFISRDRFGVKPLYYLYDEKHFIFASELKAFMALPPGLKPDFDLRMVALMSNLESVEKTLLNGVKILNGGHSLILRQSGSPNIKKWWDTCEHLVDVPVPFVEQVAQYKEIFYDACKIRMRSDVPIGTALSGGVDSSAVHCTIADISSGSSNNMRRATDWQRAFMLNFTDTSHSEKNYAEKVISHTGATPIYKELPISSITPEMLMSSIFSLEAIQNCEPHIGPWLIYKEMKKHGVSVSIDGHGGDETVSGYHHHPKHALKDALWPWQLRRWNEVQSVLRGLYSTGFPSAVTPAVPTHLEIIKDIVSPNAGRITRMLQHFPEMYSLIRTAYRWLRSMKKNMNYFAKDDWLLTHPGSPLGLKPERNKMPHFDNLNSALYHEFHYGCLPTFHRNYDRQSMSHGVEIRAPFLDWRLVTYSFSLPSNAKLGGGYTKRILREAMHGVLPDSIRNRKNKIGFASPMVEWYQNSLKDFVLDSINSQEFLESNIWNGQLIRNYTEACYKKKEYKNATKSWQFIQTMILMRMFREKSFSYQNK